ncbi:DUF2975 domain-containing protein [Tenuibacillus multivorans]|uniref:DUF2975 domain-containing protein n=1 Tax=Tenuibacillus multivorans TaxID=237069 RepID=A0A1H0BTL7_9BACI|nr:DUF2975 domain-containing protein [Tenuibacillus multivorans]GEL77041.1 hypothetical protein TMU01_12760 [Tenuibacillus multivorans]SDN48913.1 Protein of unknown function [Tenuibacillus multivorans]
MSLRPLFKAAYILFRTLFFVTLPIALFNCVYHIAFLFFPNSEFTSTFGELEPIFSYLTIDFQSSPTFLMNQNMMVLSFMSGITLFVLALIVLRLLDKLFQNVYHDSLFIKENVKLFYTMGILILTLGSLFFYIDGLIFEKTINALNITNASIAFSNISFVDTIVSGITLILIGAALKVAVQAVEENKYTI